MSLTFERTARDDKAIPSRAGESARVQETFAP